ncbi:molecular chaperone HscC [Lachnospiraceae bacterium NE2001]|nr:molecular chaperone HscC [Lachnospiraceae bacterium NE2001]
MIVGIDLGTTNSLIAYYTEEGPKIIPNRLGERLTPSVVSIDENETVYVGKTAQERMRLYPESSAAVFKRDMGSDKKYNLSGKEFTAEELSSFVLRSLKEDAEEYLGEEIEEAVISVPAYFNDMRRKATKRAGELAGLKVERIISEPTAAAIAYGLYNDDKPAKNLVFDLGGGTLDVSILDYFAPILEVRAVAGDNYLGGEDFTAIIEDMFYKGNPDIKKEELSYREVALIHKAAEQSKIELSDNGSTTMKAKVGDEEISYDIAYADFDKACESLYEKIRVPVKRALTDAKLKLTDIDKIVLVGGGTRLTGVRSFVSKMFHTFPDTSINPDEAVALGAAIQAAMKERKESIKEVVLTDVCPFTLGTEVVIELGEGYKESGHYCPIIERNTIIPASRTDRFYTTHDKQTRIDIRVLQGESRMARNNLELGVLEIEVPSNKAGAESVDVTYTYDINSILEVEVRVISTDKKYRKIIKGQYTEMTDEEIEKRFQELAYLKIPPRDQEENKLILLRAERMYEEALGMDREVLEAEVRKFELALNSQDKRIIEKERGRLKEFLDGWE